MKVLVTGATGFLGQHLCHRLHQEGYSVTALGRNIALGKQLAEKGMFFNAIDLEDKKNILNACQQQDYIFHCAALSSLWGKEPNFYATNVLGTENIILASFGAKVKKLIYVSSPSIYFDFSPKTNIKENMVLPNKSANYYIQTKKEAEKIIDHAYHQGLNVITLRPRGLFGPHDNAVLPRVMRLIKKDSFPVVNQGQALLDLTYIDNVVEALILAMYADSNHNGKKYNITNDHPIQLKIFLTLLFKELNLNIKFKNVSYRLAYFYANILEKIAQLSLSQKEPLLTRYSIALLGLTQTLNIEAAKEDLKYKPIVSLEEGIHRTALFWKKHYAT